MVTSPKTKNLKSRKIKQRGFVMTGGGAKGLYEAGVIQALHLTGMEFDVITGSSIGAINSVFFAEYLLRKHELHVEVRRDPLKVIDRMDGLIKAYHHAWLQLPDKRLIDDSESGPLGKLKDDLLHFNLSLPQLVRLGWWWTSPRRDDLAPVGVWPSLIRIGNELIERLGGIGQLLRVLKDGRASPVRYALVTYLARFGMAHSLIPVADEGKLSDIFTRPISALRREHLTGPVSSADPPGTPTYILIDPDRTLRDFSRQQIAVRLTRANYRTGRLEISAWVTVENFVRFLQRQAWRLRAYGPDKLPLGSFRLQVPGNPNAIQAALCSGRFPGVFAPYPIDALYPAGDPENHLLKQLLAGWLEDPGVEKSLQQAFHRLNPPEGGKAWDAHYKQWRDPQAVGAFFPKAGDSYVDGGTIDNTPTSSAVDYVREWIEDQQLSKRDVVLDLLTIFLEPEPRVEPDKARDPAIFEVVSRTLAIQAAAKKTSDASTVGTVNTFGARGEQLGRVLQVLLESYREALKSLAPAERRRALAELQEKVRALFIRELSLNSDDPEGKKILERVEDWCSEVIATALPLHVNIIKIFPEKMPMDTLQFTERLGYKKENAIEMLTMGCYDTLISLRRQFEGRSDRDLDERDRQVLALTRKWMGAAAWPSDEAEQERALKEWRCQRTACVYHSEFCIHGDARLAIAKT
jgi:predicted acylesterase/phospholipase RssA